MSEEIARQWLRQANANANANANAKDYHAHMNLISKRVSITGVPEFENLGYEDWAAQCKHEFENNLLHSVRYDGFKLVAATAGGIMFKAYEVVEGTDGGVNAHGVEVLLEKEQDNKWRVVQERILSPEEVVHDKLI